MWAEAEDDSSGPFCGECGEVVDSEFWVDFEWLCWDGPDTSGQFAEWVVLKIMFQSKCILSLVEEGIG